MSMEEKIKSVGIDIGTSTTQMIFSELTICNTAGSYVVPRIHIVDKRVVYRSPIYFTPLIGDALIDIEAIEKILRKEYAKAGVAPADLQTGAVIITGDSARKENADIVLQALSDMAGNFVVATAGPSLESVLSAKGAGTDNLSRKKRKVMANIDIGGGTSNIAVFDRGKLIGTTCLDIGGRLVRVEGGRITAVFPKIAALAERRGIPLHVGEPADLQQLERLCEIMADHLFQAINRQTRTPNHGSLYTNDGAPLPQVLHMDALTLSGGVAENMRRLNAGEALAPFLYGDIGVLLAKALKHRFEKSETPVCEARETIRATVVGAGSHTVNVSGSTIHYEANTLPIKNIPVLKIGEEEATDPKKITETIRNKLSLFGDGESPVAIGLLGTAFSTFAAIQTLAEAIVNGAKAVIEGPSPLIVIVENDIGKALGNAMALRVRADKPIISLDGIYTADGDYIDIGEPVAGGRVCPVIVKTIIFNT